MPSLCGEPGFRSWVIDGRRVVASAFGLGGFGRWQRCWLAGFVYWHAVVDRRCEHHAGTGGEALGDRVGDGLAQVDGALDALIDQLIVAVVDRVALCVGGRRDAAHSQKRQCRQKLTHAFSRIYSLID